MIKTLKRRKPELLAPAGTFEKAVVAFRYGADAVYIGGPHWGLRQGAGNFSYPRLRAIVALAHKQSKKIYIAANILAWDCDFDIFPDYLAFLDEIGVDGVIFSDFGAAEVMLKGNYRFQKHLSTQGTILNSAAARFWKERGIDRIVPGRELTIKEAETIAQEANVEVELFVHGSMCISYSGKCLISNFTAGRDANRGGCAQSCRWRYDLRDKNGVEHQVYPLNSRDLNGFHLIPELVDAGIHSLKIEGRMKSNYYVARTIATYRRGIDHYLNDQFLPEEGRDLGALSNRGFITGSLEKPASFSSIRYDSSKYKAIDRYIGMVEVVVGHEIWIAVRDGFDWGKDLFLLLPDGAHLKITEGAERLDGTAVTRCHPNTVVKTVVPVVVEPYTVLFIRGS